MQTLTPREIEVVKLTCEDLSHKMIADKLGISFHTAKNHGRNIKEKLGVHTKSGVIRFAFENGII